MYFLIRTICVCCMCVFVFVWCGGQKLRDVVFYCCPPYSLSWGLLLKPQLPDWARQDVWSGPGICLPSRPLCHKPGFSNSGLHVCSELNYWSISPTSAVQKKMVDGCVCDPDLRAQEQNWPCSLLSAASCELGRRFLESSRCWCCWEKTVRLTNPAAL